MRTYPFLWILGLIFPGPEPCPGYQSGFLMLKTVPMMSGISSPYDFGNTCAYLGFSAGLSLGLLRPNIPGRRPTLVPEQKEVELLACGRRDLQHHPPTVGNDLGGHVDDPAAQCARITNRLHHRRAHILFERLVQKKGYHHGVVEGGVGRKSLERQLLEAKILQRAVHQFIVASTVISGNDFMRVHQAAVPGILQRFVNGLPHAEVGVQHRVGPGEAEQHLLVLIKRPAEDGPREFLPALAAVPKLQILPHLPPSLIAAPLRSMVHVLFDGFIKSAPTDVTYAQFLKGAKQLMVEKSAIHANDDRNLASVGLADFSHHMPDHLFHRIPMVTVGISSTEHRVDHKAFPGHLKRLEPFDPLVGGPHSVAHSRLVVVQHHAVHAQDHHAGRFQPKTPHKELLQKMAKQINSRPPKRSKEPLDRMGGEHAARLGLRGPRIARIPGKGIKMNQMPARAVQEKNKRAA